MEQVRFSQVSALTPLGEGRFAGDVHGEWTIADKPNGGYLLAMLGRAATQVGPHPDVIAASAHYLRPPDPGAVTLEAELLRGGRSASQLRVRMVQDGQACIESTFTTSTLNPATEPYWSAGVPDAGSGTFDGALRLPPVNPLGMHIPIMGQADVRIDRASLGFGRGTPSGRGELYGWLALPEDETFDSLSLLYAIDAFPPATFDVEMTGWVPTLSLTAYVRAVPAPGPVRILQKAHLVDAQRVDEGCWVWDRTGRLVAQGTQLAGIRLG
jgi:hypothetical protein